MQQLGCAELIHLKPLRNVVAAQGAIGADVVGLAAILHGRHAFEQRFANLHGLLVVRLFDAKSAGVARAALEGVDAGARNHLEHFFGLLADVLHPAMTGNLVAHVAQRHREINFQQTVAFALHQVFKRVPHRVLDPLHVRFIRVHQRDFLLEHQGATGHCRQNGKTVFGIFGQHRDVGFFTGVDRLHVAQFEFGHAATFFLFHQHVGNVVVIQNLEQVQANAGLVVIDEAGGKNGHLAGCLLTVLDDARFGLGRCRAKLFACK